MALPHFALASPSRSARLGVLIEEEGNARERGKLEGAAAEGCPARVRPCGVYMVLVCKWLCLFGNAHFCLQQGCPTSMSGFYISPGCAHMPRAYKHLHMYMDACTHVHTHACLCMCVCTFVCVHACMYV